MKGTFTAGYRIREPDSNITSQIVSKIFRKPSLTEHEYTIRNMLKFMNGSSSVYEGMNDKKKLSRLKRYIDINNLNDFFTPVRENGSINVRYNSPSL